MSESVKVQCPGCQKILKIPNKFRGKVVNCPGCKTAFQIAAPTTSAPEPTASPQANPLPFEIDLPSTVPAAANPQLTTDNFSAQTMHDPLAQDPLAPLPASDPNAMPPATGHWQGTPQYQNKKKKKSRREKHANSGRKNSGDEAENNLAGIGYTLVVLAILATVLPMFGLQLRRLRNAGQFAPLIGMALGLVGAGLVAAGGSARNRGISLATAGVLGVIVLAVGITGFQMERNRMNGGGNGFANADGIPQNNLSRKQREKNAKDELDRIKNPQNSRQPAFQPVPFPPQNPGGATPFNPFADSNKGRLNRGKSNIGTSDAQDHVADMHQDALNRAADAIAEQKRMMEQNRPGRSPFQTGGTNPFNSNSPNGSSGQNNVTPPANNGTSNASNNSGAPNNPFSSGRPGRGSGSPFAGNGNNPFGGTNPFGGNSPASGAGSESDFRSRNNEGLDTMQFRVSGNADLNQNYRFVPIAGSDAAFGKIFFQPAPISGIEFARFDHSAFMMPADSSRPTHSNRLDVPEGQAIVGLNFNFQNGQVKGVQCIFAKPDEKRARRFNIKETTTSEWIGDEIATEHAVSTMTRGRPVVGLAVFNDMRAITGVQLITTKK